MKLQRTRLALLGLASGGLLAAVVPTTLPAASTDDALAACRSIEDDAERLACFDGVLASGKAVTSKPPAGETAAMPEKAETPREAPAPVSPEPAAAEKPPAAPEPAPVRKAPADPEPAARPATLTDDIGRETVKDQPREVVSVRGRVTRCIEGRSGKYVFYFDNGQVWRQRGSANVNWKTCDFGVTIQKDVFGYYLTRDDSSRKVRIERVE